MLCSTKASHNIRHEFETGCLMMTTMYDKLRWRSGLDYTICFFSHACIL